MIKTIAVTGGAGFIGSHVTELLCDAGFSVVVIDDLSTGYRKFVDKRSTFMNVSLDDSRRLVKALSNVDAVMHLAASSIISESYAHPEHFFENNVMNGIRLLEAMKVNNIKKIIYSSTSSVYGEPATVPITEDVCPNPPHPYAASKLAFEHVLQSYYHAYGIESVTLRYYNVYGPRDEQKPATRAVPMWIQAILKGEPVPWYWQGRQTRDYVYVRDVARAHRMVLPLKGIHCFNIGSGTGIVMKDVLKTLETIVGKKLATTDLGERKGDYHRSFADITKINKIVGWKPTVTLTQGLTETYAYYAHNKR